MKNRVLEKLKFYILKEKTTLLLLLAISMISSLAAIVQPLLMQQFIDKALISKDIDTFSSLVFIIVVVSILSIALSVFLQYRYTHLCLKVLYHLRADIFEKIFLNNKLFFQKYKVGDFLSRLEGDISELQRFGVDSIFALFSALLGLIGAVVVMFFFDASLALFALILLPIEFILLKPMYPKMHEVTKEVRQSNAMIGSFIIESLRYVNFLKKFNLVENRKERLIVLQGNNKENILKQQKVQLLFTQMPVVISLIARTTLIIFGGLKAIHGEISVGELIAFLSYFTMVLAPVHTLLGILNNLPKLKVSMQRLEDILPQKLNHELLKTVEYNLDITFDDVSFAYHSSNTILEKMNLHIPFGQKVVLTGVNGAGKSTMIDLMTNFLEPNSGTILLNNTNIKEIDNTILQNHIGLVEQTPVILAATLKENLLVAQKDASDRKLIEVLNKVGLTFWFQRLENGLETLLSEDGGNLSGGQKQRLSIARAILKNPSIAIFDEPTSSMDTEFVQIIDELIDSNFKEATKIIVSHHACYQNARYLRIENKQIIEVNHE